MAFDVGSVTATVTADIGDFKRKMGEAEDSLNGFKGGLSKVSGVLTSVGKQAAIFTGIVGGATVVAIKDSIGAFNEANAIAAQTTAVLTSTGKATAEWNKLIYQTASALESQTTFSDDAIQSAENMLLTFTSIGKDIFPQATETVLNMSQALGQDMKSSSIQLGKALNDPINGVTALRRVGVALTEQQLEQIKTLQESGDLMGAQKVILKELAVEFGGSASAAAQTFGGKMQQLNNKINNFQEAVGEALVNVLYPLVDGLTQFLSSGVLEQFIGYLEDFLSNFSGVAEWISTHQELVLAFLKGLAVALGALLILGTIAILIMAVTNPIFLLVAAITALYMAWESNFLGIRDLTTMITNWITEHWETIKTVTKAVFDVIIGTIKLAWAIISGVFQVALALIKGDWRAAWDALVNMTDKAWDAIKQIFNGALSFVGAWGGAVFDKLTEPFRNAWNSIQDLVRKIRDAMDFTKRHSPSIMDILNRSVNLANAAFENLDFGLPNVSPVINTGGNSQTTNPMYNSIKIDMGNSIITSEAEANRMGELIGNSIIRDLQKSVKF